MADLRLVSKAMFNKKGWDKIPDSEKESCFFIFNRYFSKKYPIFSYMLNKKEMDKVLAMDLWYEFMKDKPYPSWFWSKSPKKEKPTIPNKDYNLLKKNMRISDFNLDYLIENNLGFVKNELKHFRKAERLNK